MRLLIVDDQLSTTQGIAQKIDWAGEGVNKVCTAQDAMEARLQFQEQIPDIMLCDIEMPVESGIDLCRWVRQQGYTTAIIFLTCHADFEYAQEAISLNAADYIVQPAPYDKIRDSVRKVLTTIRQSNAAERKLAELARNSITFLPDLYSRFLRGDSTAELQNNMAPFSVDNPRNYLVLLQIVRWTSVQEHWQGNLMCTALRSFVQEIFEPGGCLSIVSYIEADMYAIALQDEKRVGFDMETLQQSLSYLCGVFKMYMPCLVACYPAGPLPIPQMPKVWDELQKRRDQNVARRTGVFGVGEAVQAQPSSDALAQWNELLQCYDPLRFVSESIAYIDKLTQQGQMSEGTLRYLYQSLVKFLYNAGDMGNVMEHVFSNNEAAEFCRNAVKSVDGMKQFIQCVEPYFKREDDSKDSSTVSLVMQYVGSHIGDDIRIEDIANVVHFSPDYVSRIFKKEQGCSIKTYIIQQKMLEAHHFLRGTTLPVGVIAARLGYQNFSHFSAAYKKVMGYAPSEEREEKT